MSRLLSCCIETTPDFLPRARYAVSMLLAPLGLTPAWTDRDALAAPGLYVGEQPPNREVLHLPHALKTATFFRAGLPLEPQEVRWIDWEGARWPILFPEPTGTDRGDLVAGTFYWLSGWQEHVRSERDRHGRFLFAFSLQAEIGIPHLPVVDAYRAWLAEQLEGYGVDVSVPRYADQSWALCPTHDIDYARKWTPGILYREGVEYALLNRRGMNLAQRVRRLGQAASMLLTRPDPYRTSFKRLIEVEQETGAGATYFLKAGQHGPHDARTGLKGRYMRGQVQTLVERGFEIGLHPGYYGHTHRGYLVDEKARLEHVTGQPCRLVRQHYLRYDQTLTPRLQTEAGFALDSTLGFSDHEGFRRGTCQPFQVYDVGHDEPLSIWEVPLHVMDSTLFHYRQYSLEEALEATRQILNWCRRFNGVAVLLWHNILYDALDYPDWHRHFETILAEAKIEGAYLGGLQDVFTRWQTSLS